MPPHDPNRPKLDELAQPHPDDLRIHRHSTDDADDTAHGDGGGGGSGAGGGSESVHEKAHWDRDTRGQHRELGRSGAASVGDRDAAAAEAAADLEGRTRAPER